MAPGRAAYDSRVRGLLLGLIWITACYAPSVPSNVRCSASGTCPDGQSCIGGFCTTGGTLPPDMMVVGADSDHDGIPDDQDNCRDVANNSATDMQSNEDGDKFGDACDLCPQIPDNTNADADGDKIGDACDPNPGMRDTVWIYEGFHNGLPSWSRSLNWTAVGDKVRTNAPQNTNQNSEYMFPPFKPTGVPDNFTVTIVGVVDQILGTTGDHSFGIEIYDTTQMKGVDCGIAQAPAGSNFVLFLDDDFGALTKETPFTWTTGVEYRILLARHGRNYNCSVVGPTSTTSQNGDSNVVPRDGNSVDFWAYGMNAQFGSVSLLGTP